MQTTIGVQTEDGVTVTGWLHRAKAQNHTLVVYCHGHNTDATRSRVITFAKWLEHHGFDCLRWNVTRPFVEGTTTLRVTSESEEVAQARAIVRKLRPQYKRIIAVGHSQGSVTAIQLGLENLADAVVSVMGVVDTQDNQRGKLASIGITLPDLHAGQYADFTMENGQTVRYTAAFFADIANWHVEPMLHELHKPILFVLGERDTSISPAEVERGFAAANEPKALLRVDDKHRYSDETAMQLAKALVEWPYARMA